MIFTAILPLRAGQTLSVQTLLSLLHQKSDFLADNLKENPESLGEEKPSFLLEGRLFSIDYAPVSSPDFFEGMRPAFAKYALPFLEHIEAVERAPIMLAADSYPRFVKLSLMLGQGDDHLERLRSLGLFLQLSTALMQVEKAEFVLLPFLQEYHEAFFWEALTNVMLDPDQPDLSRDLLHKLFVDLQGFTILFQGDAFQCYRSKGLSAFIGTELELLPHPSGTAVKAEWFAEVLSLLLQDSALPLLKAGGLHVQDGIALKAEMANSLAIKGEAVLRLHPKA